MQSKTKLIFLIAAVLTSSLLLSCKNKKTREAPDVSDIQIDLSLLRFDTAFYGASEPEDLLALREKYPDFYSLFTSDILLLRDMGSPEATADTLFKYFVSDTSMQQLYDSCQFAFRNMEKVRNNLESAFRYWKYYFPESEVLPVYTYVAPFIYQVVLADSFIAIELDMYLGENAYFYQRNPNIPAYISHRLDKDFLPANVMVSLLQDKFPISKDFSTVLDHMLYQAKIWYSLDLLLPQAADSLKTGFTPGQLAWCEANENDIWAYLYSEDLLFSQKTEDIQRLTGEAPRTIGMPPESPGKAAIWVGREIIRAYMNRKPETSLEELFGLQDGAKVLNDSRYQPG